MWYNRQVTVRRPKFPIVLLALVLLVPASVLTAESHAHLGDAEAGHWWIATPDCPWHPDFSPAHGEWVPPSTPFHLESGALRFCSSRATELTGNLPQSPLPLRTLTSPGTGPVVDLPTGFFRPVYGQPPPFALPGDGPLLPLRI